MRRLLLLLLILTGCARHVTVPTPKPPAVTIQSYQVQLTWQAPASSGDPVAGYYVWRSSAGADYVQLNAAAITTTSYVDYGVNLSTAYEYYVTSVDVEGNQSAPSNIYAVTIPSSCTYANPGDC